jgi:hypothetical protein
MSRAPIYLETSPTVPVSIEVPLEPTLCDDATQPVFPSSRRRQIPPLSGKALEVLGHAIEYLADEYVLHAGSLPSLHSEDPQIRAIQLLMAASRTVYWSCPVAPTLRERVTRVLWRTMGAGQLPRHSEHN